MQSMEQEWVTPDYVTVKAFTDRLDAGYFEAIKAENEAAGVAAFTAAWSDVQPQLKVIREQNPACVEHAVAIGRRLKQLVEQHHWRQARVQADRLQP